MDAETGGHKERLAGGFRGFCHVWPHCQGVKSQRTSRHRWTSITVPGTGRMAGADGVNTEEANVQGGVCHFLMCNSLDFCSNYALPQLSELRTR